MPKPFFLQIQPETIIRQMAKIMPGIKPPAKISPTDTPALMAYTTMGMLGGIIGPIVPATHCTPAENSGGNPFFSISGIIIPPMAAQVAGAEPDRAAKKAEARIIT